MKQFIKLTLIAGAVICMASPVTAQKALAKADLAFDNHQYFSAVELYKSAYTTVKKPDMKAKVLIFSDSFRIFTLRF